MITYLSQEGVIDTLAEIIIWALAVPRTQETVWIIVSKETIRIEVATELAEIITKEEETKDDRISWEAFHHQTSFREAIRALLQTITEVAVVAEGEVAMVATAVVTKDAWAVETQVEGTITPEIKAGIKIRRRREIGNSTIRGMISR